MKKRIGVYICHCGSNISDYVDVEKVKEVAEEEEVVVLAKTTMFACADSTQKEIIEDIKSQNLDALVVASCSPKLHLFTFRSVAERAGLNPYSYVQVNIREQCSWAHSDKKPEATDKAIRLVKSGIARVKHSEPLTLIKISAENVVIVVGAGIAGMRASIELANMGSYVYLIEREHFVGGRASQWNELFTTNETAREVVARLYDKIKKHDKITLFTGAEVISNKGGVGNFEIKIKIKPRHIEKDCDMDMAKFEKAVEVCPIEVDDDFNFNLNKRKAIYKNYPSEYPSLPAIDTDTCNKCGECVKICSSIILDQKEEIIDLTAGAYILTTGFDPYEPPKGEYGYGEIDNVITLQQFKRLIELNESKLEYKGKAINNIAYIYCVGSRQIEGENKYCSRYCCTSAIHTAIIVKNKYADINNLHYNRGIRTYGKQEVLYKQSSLNGDMYLQFFDDIPQVEYHKDKIIIKVRDFLTKGKEIEAEVDLVVLVTGMVPRKDNTIGNILKVPNGRDKFYNEVHPKLRPVETVIDGIHISGACQGPKNISESVDSSLSAASKANSLIAKGEISIEPTLAKIDKGLCEWCDNCTEVCPYDAILKIDHKGKSVAMVNEPNCKGCGMCLPVCPTNAIQLIGYTDQEIESMIEGLIM